jgi:hypothetical protein
MRTLGIRIILVGSALWILGFLSAGPALAHHSVQAEFDVNKRVTVSGTVAKVEWINPHSYLTVDAKSADGKAERWAFELGGIGSLRKAGMRKDGLKLGDEVTVIALAAKDGSTTGHLQELKLADGQVLKFGNDANGN